MPAGAAWAVVALNATVHIPATIESDNMDTAQRSIPAGGAALPAEIARFDALAGQWWDTRGPMRALHAMNPVRTQWADAHLPGPGTLLDVGCGAGLAAEAFARMGHRVTGIDAAGGPIEVARAHAAAGGLAIDYRQAETTDLTGPYDAVTALEVIEHVADPADFLRELARLARPGGVVVLSTINRTARSLVVAKWGAEYLLRMLPTGTHNWRKFPTPAELAVAGRAAGLRLVDSAGMTFNPLAGGWRITRDLAVNYIVAFSR